MNCVTVLFGSDLVRKFFLKYEFEESELINSFKYYEFNSKEELDAFILGLEEAKGWNDLIYFRNENFLNNRLLRTF